MYSLRRKLYTNYTQTLHSTLHRSDSPLVAKCIVCASNYTQTIHKLYIKPYIEAFQTLHCERSQNYTRSGTQTLHFVFEHESREWNLEREWSESYVTFVTNVTNVTNVSNVRNVKQEMAIGGDATRHSCAPFRHSFPLPQKSNNFESFFSDSTLTFLTFGNTFRLPILPTRRIIFLCLPLIKI